MFVVLGLGAIGSNLTYQLSKRYEQEIIGVDFDNIEERNLHTQCYLKSHIGMPKAQAMSIVLNLSNRKPCAFKPVIKKIESVSDIKQFINEKTIVLDCFDNSASRKIVNELSMENVLHIGFNPQYTAEIIWNEKYDVPGSVDPNNNDICEVRDAIHFINFVVSFAGYVIDDYIVNDVRGSYIITNKKNIISI